MSQYKQSEQMFDSYTTGKDKYVLFGLAGETYGVSIFQALEILDKYELTILPGLPEFFDGVISLRDLAVPVINLRRRFGLPQQERDSFSRVIVVENNQNPIGIQVDEIFHLAVIDQEKIVPPPTYTLDQKTEFISGVWSMEDGRFVILIDVEQILASQELIEMDGVSQQLKHAFREENQDNNCATDTGADQRI
jgi:purine-binding chemotaxis protein CheW